MRKILIGRLGDAYGIQGWLHLFSHASPPENIFNYKKFFNSANQPIEFISHKPHGNHFAVKLKNCNDRDQALLLKHQDIYIDRAELPALPENVFYWDDLVGLSVITQTGQVIGTIDHLFATGANDVITVKGEKLIYIPYLPEVVLSVDLATKTMTVAWDPS